ncbi:MAG TPA: molecular chaperone [Alteraurantiacibacter sp.]
MNRATSIRRLAGLAAAFALLTSGSANAQGDLLIAPTRVEIDGRGSAQVILSNIGSEEATYRISLELRRMNPDGTLDEVPQEAVNATEQAALEMIRFSPRRVVLPPGQPQMVRISARPDPALPDGEYRAHMSFQGLPKVQPVADQAEAGAEEGLQIRLVPIYGITIPIIVRKGRLEAVTAISNPRIVRQAGAAMLELDMARSGDRSTFGEIRVIKPGLADPVVLARGIAIYTEVGARKLTLPVTPEQAAEMRSGNLRFEYRELPEKGGALIAAVEGALS